MPRTAALDHAMNYKFAKNRPTKVELKSAKATVNGKQKIQRYSSPLI